MSRTRLFTGIMLALLPLLGFGADKPAPLAPAKLSAETIVQNNVRARGGLAAWRAVHSLAWSGQLEAGGGDPRPIPGIPGQPRLKPAAVAQEPPPQVQLPFRYEMQRPLLSRLEIEFRGETAVQVYNGTEGWKVRPFLNRHEVEPFSAEELKASATQQPLDGALIDYAAKGTKIEVEGIEPVEGQPAYKLKLTLNNGQVLHDWVDAKTFLEVRIEGTPRKLDGKYHPVFVYLRDYRPVNGLMIPHLLETAVEGVQRTEKIRVEKVEVNPQLEESRFARPT
jgi:hypothetical protein